MSRAGAAATAVALDLLGRYPGDRIPTVAEYANGLGVGIHTVQRAIAVLERAGVVLSPHGRNGTFLISFDRARLWSIAVRDSFVGYMPLPYSRRYEGLATGLREALTSLSLPFNMAYMPGARPRLKAIREGTSFAVVSALALRDATDAGAAVDLAIDLRPGSFVAAHGVIWRRGPHPVHPRVGVDDDSTDQQLLSYAQFGQEAEYVSAHYMQLVELIRRGAIDAAVWAVDALAEEDSLEYQPLTSPAAIDLDREATTAVLVVVRGDAVLGNFLKEYVQPHRVLAVQAEVLANTRPASY